MPEMPVIEPIGPRRTGYSAGACHRARRRRDPLAEYDPSLWSCAVPSFNARVEAPLRLRQARSTAILNSGGHPMLRAEDNKFLTESGAGTGMGELLRRFWLPVLLSEELPESDGPPKKIVVMGEELLAFRDSRGVVGVIDQYCPHRGANLWLGRNEECGIRCVYHGWKFDTDGRCIDMPTSYPDLNAKDLIRIKSYPVRDWGDMIWAKLGPAGEVPELS